MTSRRTGGQRALITFNIVLVVLALLAATALAYGYRQVSKINRVALDAVLTPLPTTPAPTIAAGEDEPPPVGPGPENYLIVGTDSGTGLDPEDGAGQNRPAGARSDTIMILRVDPASDRAALLSLPRDLLVPIPGSGARGRINQAVNDGGPELLVRTIQQAFSIPVHHYVEIDFRGFYELVDAIGGVPVPFFEPARDFVSGLDIPDPGCITLGPETALSYVRARHYEVFHDGRWRGDPSSDLGRISRQQDFVRRALRRAIARGARNPAVLDDLLDAALGNVIVDDRLTPGDLVDLASKFRSFEPESLEMFSLPVLDDVVNGAAVLRLREADARPILDRFRGVEAGALTPASVILTVRNGTGRPGLGAEVAAALRGAGFTVPEDAVVDADRFDYTTTTLLVPAGLGDAGQLVLASLVGGAQIVETDDAEVTGLELIVGSDYAGAVAPTPVLGSGPTGDVAPVPTTPEAPAEPGSAEATSTVSGDTAMTSPDPAC